MSAPDRRSASAKTRRRARAPLRAPTKPTTARGAHRFTPLICAAAGGQLATLRVLLKQSSVNLNAATGDGFTAAHFLVAWPAALRGEPKSSSLAQYEKALRQLLVASKKQPFHLTPDTLLHVAVEACNDLATRLVLQTRNEAPFVDARNALLGWTALHLAVKHGNLSMVRLLLVHGANPFVRASVVGSPRDVAQLAGQAPLEQLLADVEAEALRTLQW